MRFLLPVQFAKLQDGHPRFFFWFRPIILHYKSSETMWINEATMYICLYPLKGNWDHIKYCIHCPQELIYNAKLLVETKKNLGCPSWSFVNCTGNKNLTNRLLEAVLHGWSVWCAGISSHFCCITVFIYQQKLNYCLYMALTSELIRQVIKGLKPTERCLLLKFVARFWS